jgi:hypothetical protein
LGQKGEILGWPAPLGLAALYHTRLQDIGQVVECLEAINQALARIRKGPSALFCGFDNQGHCLIAPRDPAQCRRPVAERAGEPSGGGRQRAACGSGRGVTAPGIDN